MSSGAVKFNSGSVIFWYSLTLGISVAACLFAYINFPVSVIGGGAAAAISFFSLTAVSRVEETDSPYLVISEKIAMVGIVAFIPLILFTDLVIGLLTFLGFAQLALNFQTHDYRRFYIGCAVSLVGICVGAAETKTGIYLVYFLFYTLAVSMTLGYAYIAQKSPDTAVQWGAADRAKVASLLVFVALFIYLVLPRFPSGHLGAQSGSEHFYENDDWERQAEESHQSSDTDQLQQKLRDLAKQLQQQNDSDAGASNQTVSEKDLGEYQYQGFSDEMDIRNPDSEGSRAGNGLLAYMRADRSLYLRAQMFDLFDGRRWSKSSTDTVKLKVPREGLELNAAADASHRETYEIQVEQNLGDYIAAAAVPARLYFPGNAIGVDIFGQLKAPGALQRGTVYRAESVLNVQQNRIFAEQSYRHLASYTQLPDKMDPRITQLARDITADTKSQLQAAIALESHLRSDYDYSLESVFSSQGETPLSEFLFETRYGHCEYFASALAIMLRSLDIPARLVTGFSANQQNPLTGYYEIYALDGHAWVEAYVDGLGWLLLEPTAFYDGPMPEKSSFSAQQISNYVERQRKMREATGEAPLTPANIAITLWQTGAFAFTVVFSYLKLVIVEGWPALLVGVLLVFLGGYLWQQVRPHWLTRRVYRRALRQATGSAPVAISEYLRAINDLLHLAGNQRLPGQTIEQFLQEFEGLATQFDQQAMVADFNQTQYAPTPEGDAQRYRALLEQLYRLGYRRLRRLYGPATA